MSNDWSNQVNHSLFLKECARKRETRKIHALFVLVILFIGVLAWRLA